MINPKLMLLALCTLWSGMMVQGQAKFVSAVPLQMESGITKNVQDSGDGKVLYGYCSPDYYVTYKSGIGLRTDVDLEITAAIRFSEGVAGLLKGRKIYSLHIGVALDTEATIFLCKSDGTTLKEIKQDLVEGWNEIALESPWEIPDEKEIYIGYTCIQHPDEFVVARESATSNSNGMFLGVNGGMLVEYSDLGNLCILAEVDGREEEFEYIGSITSAYSSNPYVCRGANEMREISLSVLNEGEKNVSTIKLGRSYNGTELGDTVCAFKRTLRAHSVGELTLKVTPPETGEYVYTLKEMGDHPVSPSAEGAKFSLYNSEDAVPRMVLMEEFTSQLCGNCPKGQAALRKLITGYEDRVAMVLHHSGYYPDDFSIAESDAYCYFYNSMETYAPAMTMDRTYFTEYDRGGSGSLVFTPTTLTKARFLKELELPAMVSLGIESSYDESTRKLKVTVSGRKITDLIGDHIGLTVFLLESKYIAYQAGSGGGPDFEHNHFPRHVLSAVDGDLITFEWNRFKKEYTYTIPETYVSISEPPGETQAHPENMHIVAFVSNFDWGKPDNCVVLNAAKTSSLNEIVNGIKTEKTAESSFRFFAEGGKICVAGEYAAFHVYDLQGMSVRNENLAPGLYLVKVTGRDGKEEVRKFFFK